MKRVLTGVVAIVALLFASVSYAGETGTPEEAKALAERAEKYIKDKGLNALVDNVLAQKPEFKFKDLYVFVAQKDGVNVAHGMAPQLKGRNLSNLKDITGTYITKEMVKVSYGPKGRGWVDYKWPNAKTKQIRDKTTYVIKIDDVHWIGVGANKN